MSQPITYDDAGVAAPAPPRVSEDWTAVGIGAVLIGLVLLGLRPGTLRFGWTNIEALMVGALSPSSLFSVFALGTVLLVSASAGAAVMGVPLGPFVRGFPIVFLLGWVSQVVAGHTTVSAYGLEYVFFALVLGLVLGQTTSLRERFREAVQAEYFIKIGLVILGSTVVFGELIGAGMIGIVQALVVVISVWFFTFWLCRRLGVDDEFGALLSSAVSICGVSAAIAACGAIQGDRRKLSYVTSLVLVVAVPMMVVMPWVAQVAGMPQAVAGAWLGGTLDTSAAVVAAGEMLSSQARNAAVVVKLSQNVLIGVAAFLLTVWWAVSKGDRGASPGIAVIWERFPKFVLGFVAVSVLYSFLLPEAAVTASRGTLNAMRTAWFAMAFVCIGLETSPRDLVVTGDGRPALAFVGGQAFNILVTLIAAYLLFGGLLLPAPRFGG
jgi:uncharacterized integral membrane protein (TIGR00698 family)